MQIFANAQMSTRLLIGNLPVDCDEQSLVEWLSSFGTIGAIDMPLNARSGRPLGYAYVSIEVSQPAPQVVRALNGNEFAGRRITCELIESQPKPVGSFFDFLRFGRKAE